MTKLPQWLIREVKDLEIQIESSKQVKWTVKSLPQGFGFCAWTVKAINSNNITRPFIFSDQRFVRTVRWFLSCLQLLFGTSFTLLSVCKEVALFIPDWKVYFLELGHLWYLWSILSPGRHHTIITCMGLFKVLLTLSLQCLTGCQHGIYQVNTWPRGVSVMNRLVPS